MYKHANINTQTVSTKFRSASNKIATVVHAWQCWNQPEKGTTWPGTKENPNTNYCIHFYTDKPSTAPNLEEPKSITIAREKAKRLMNTKVYLVKFALKSNPNVVFLKIGITSYNVHQRFDADIDKFHCIELYSIKSLRRADALALEHSLHKLYHKYNQRPETILLSGGNTECFKYSSELEHEMITQMKSFSKN